MGERRRQWLIPLSTALAAAAFLWPATRQAYDHHHDGLVLKTSMDVASGSVLFRDTFTQYGPLTTYLQAGALKLFVATLPVLRQSATVALAIGAASWALAWSRFMPMALALASFGLWLLFFPS